MDGKQYSLKLRLLVLIAVPLIFAGMMVGGLSLLNAYHEIEEVYDAELAYAAKLFLHLTEHELSEHKKNRISLEIEEGVTSHPYEKNIAFRIWKKDRLVTQSKSASTFGAFRAQPGFSNHILDGVKWRFFVYFGEKDDITVEVAEKQDVRMDITLDLAESLMIPASLFVPLILILVWLGTHKSLSPLVCLSEAVDRRDIDDLSPLQMSAIPREINALVKALNNLFLRMEESIRREREFTDNAAHELRTPLAAMKTQAQVLLKETKDSKERQSLENLLRSINRASRMVSQLLSFARLQSQDISFEKTNLSEVVTETVRDLSSLAVAKKQTYEADIEPDMFISGNRDSLHIMVRNIVENAVKFTPENGSVHIRLAKENGRGVLCVSDTGPGIPDSLKEKIFERFYRENKSKTEGSGLGLAIVKWICDVHKARIEITSNTSAGMIFQAVFSLYEK